ncbi:peroxiredoxin [Candidatus Marsarchaeota archaeon]|nr:peroxiredoxin [Candidatus Marsarchaeota archaeon]
MLKEGSKAPDFRLVGEDGRMHSLGDFKSKYLVLYFYPKDLTPGCTIQAMTYSRKLGALKKLGATVVGVSKDDIELHKKFKSKCRIKFLLLSDPSSKTIKAYGAYGDRGIFGMGTLRNTYIISRGRVVRMARKVDPYKDPANAIEFIKAQR